MLHLIGHYIFKLCVMLLIMLLELRLGQTNDRKLCDINYTSKTLNSTQFNYITTKKELLAIVFSFDKFHSYLISTHVLIYTVHFTIKFLITKKRCQT